MGRNAHGLFAIGTKSDPRNTSKLSLVTALFETNQNRNERICLELNRNTIVLLEVTNTCYSEINFAIQIGAAMM